MTWHGPDLAPYVHDRSLTAQAAVLVDAAYESAARWWDVADSLRAQSAEAGIDAESPLIRELTLAASYALRLEHGGKAGCDLRPHTDVEDFAWPPRISEVAPDVVALWRDVAELAQHPAARARFADLLFERRDRPVRDRAVAAVTAYLDAARSRQQADLDVAAFLVRAWDLARRTSSWQLLGDVCSELADQADTAMSRTPPVAPGIVLPIIAALATKPARRQVEKAPHTAENQSAVTTLLDTAFRIYTERLATHARIRAENQGQTLAEGLRRMVDSYGVPEEYELAAFLSSDGQSDQALALSLARALRHF